MTSALAPLLQLPDVAPALSAARHAVDGALRSVGRSGGAVGVEVGLRSAVASAALEGHPFGVEEARAGTVTDLVLQGSLRVSTALASLAGRWPVAPRQVLARLHLLAARGIVPDSEVGRPLAASSRLDLLCELGALPAYRAAQRGGRPRRIALRPRRAQRRGGGGGPADAIADGLDPRLIAPSSATRSRAGVRRAGQRVRHRYA
jgi:hypothetical protein